MNENDQFFLQQNMKRICCDEFCSVYQMKNDTGDGTATFYEIYPGIGVMYNDFHMESCPSRKFENNTHTISIHHCREGRIEWEVSNGAYLYLASGDIMLDCSTTENKQCSFPVSHYHGITITISVPDAIAGMDELFSTLSIDLEKLEQLFALKKRPFIMHGDSVPDHVISELYRVPDSIRLEYLRVKVLELLVTLKTVDPSILGEERPYLYKTQVEKVKAIMAFMAANPERHFTMEELSARYNISVSALKQCFKGIYGTPIYTYMRNYRMDLAASLLTQTDDPVTVIAAFNQSSSSYEKFAKAVQSFKDYTLKWYQSTWKLMNFISAVLPSTFLGTLPIGMYLYLNGSLTPQDLVMCLILSLGIVGPLMNFTTYVNETKTVEYAVHDVDKLLHVEELPDIQQDAQVKSKTIELKNVSFSYDKENGKQVLSHINIKIPEGKFTALVGPSGGGKSTIARLIARFWDVTEGEIQIGSVDIRSIPLAQLADLVSFVTQDNFLFHCSIKENIRLGNPQATDDEVYAAAKAACCDEFIKNLGHGYDTTAGDAGNRLSGGEKQRISIARMILKNAPIVILDEATAFTDQENEEKIQQSIAALTKGKTLLVIAHRLSTIKNADQIVVLKDGQVENIGTHGQLLEKDTLYRDMWEAHIGAQNWSAGSGKRR